MFFFFFFLAIEIMMAYLALGFDVGSAAGCTCVFVQMEDEDEESSLTPVPYFEANLNSVDVDNIMHLLCAATHGQDEDDHRGGLGECGTSSYGTRLAAAQTGNLMLQSAACFAPFVNRGAMMLDSSTVQHQPSCVPVWGQGVTMSNNGAYPVAVCDGTGSWERGGRGEVLNEAADGHNSGHDVLPLHQQQKGIKCTASCSSCPTTIQAFCKCSEEDAAQPLQQPPGLALDMDIISVAQLAGTTTLDQIVSESLCLHSSHPYPISELEKASENSTRQERMGMISSKSRNMSFNSNQTSPVQQQLDSDGSFGMQNKSDSCCGSNTTDLQMLALRYPIGILGASDLLQNLMPDTSNLLLYDPSPVFCNNQL